MIQKDSLSYIGVPEVSLFLLRKSVTFATLGVGDKTRACRAKTLHSKLAEFTTVDVSEGWLGSAPTEMPFNAPLLESARESIYFSKTKVCVVHSPASPHINDDRDKRFGPDVRSNKTAQAVPHASIHGGSVGYKMTFATSRTGG